MVILRVTSTPVLVEFLLSSQRIFFPEVMVLITVPLVVSVTVKPSVSSTVIRSAAKPGFSATTSETSTVSPLSPVTSAEVTVRVLASAANVIGQMQAISIAAKITVAKIFILLFIIEFLIILQLFHSNLRRECRYRSRNLRYTHEDEGDPAYPPCRYELRLQRLP